MKNKDSNKSVYIVTCGSYSGYHIVAVYDNKKDAKMLAESYMGTVERYKLNPELPQMAKDGYKIFNVEMSESGGTHFAQQYEYDALDLCNSYRIEMDDDTLVMTACVQGKDRDHAIYIVNKRRLKLLADNQFIPTNSLIYFDDIK